MPSIINLGVLLLSICALTASQSAMPMKLNTDVLVPCTGDRITSPQGYWKFSKCLDTQYCAECEFKESGVSRRYCSDPGDKGLCHLDNSQVSCKCPQGKGPIRSPVSGSCSCASGQKCAVCGDENGQKTTSVCFNPKDRNLCDAKYKNQCSCGQLIPDSSHDIQVILPAPEMLASDTTADELGYIPPVPAVAPLPNYETAPIVPFGSNNVVVPGQIETALGQFQEPDLAADTVPLEA